MDKAEVVDVLAQTALFGSVGPDIAVHLAGHATERHYRRDQVIFREGDHGDALFVIVSGLVKVFLKAQQDEMVLVTLRRPDTFGEVALIDSGPRSASTVALEDTVLIQLRRAALLELVHEVPDVMDSLLTSIGRSLRRLTGQTADLVFLDLEGRVAKLLLVLADQHGERGYEGEVILDLAMTQTDLAAMVGGSRQSINHILNAFQSRGYLDLQRQRVVLKRVDLLRRRAGT